MKWVEASRHGTTRWAGEDSATLCRIRARRNPSLRVLRRPMISPMQFPKGTATASRTTGAAFINGDGAEAAKAGESRNAVAATSPVLRLHHASDDLLDALAPVGRGLLLRDRAA